MASSIQDIEFLDLTDIDEAERSHLQQVLYSIAPSLELPWDVENEVHCSSGEFEPAQFAEAPIPHPTLRGIFLPQPLFTTAPAPVALGLVPSVTGGPESPNGPLEGLECSGSGRSPLAVPAPPPPAAPAPYGGSSDPGAVSLQPPPVITSMYQIVGPGTMPLSNVYVSNVTANVNVHSFVGTPLAQYTSHMQQAQAPPTLYSPGEPAGGLEPAGSPSAGRRNGLGPRRLRSKAGPGPGGGKRLVDGVSGQFGPRGHDVLESSAGPPPQPNYMIPVVPHHAFAQQPFYPSQPPPQHPSAQHATGPPLFLPGVPLFHHPHMFNTYTHAPPPPSAPAAGPPLVFSPTGAALVAGGPPPVPVPPAPFPVDEPAEERLLPEGRETDPAATEPSIPAMPLYETEDNDLKGSSGFLEQSCDSEGCGMVGTVVVNNSNLANNTCQFPEDTYKGGNDELVGEASAYNESPKEYSGASFVAPENVVAAEPKLEASPPVYAVAPVEAALLVSVVSDTDSCAGSVPLPPQAPADSPVEARASAGEPVPPVPDAPEPAAKAPSPTGPFGRSPSACTSPVSSAAATPSAPEKTWASLFNKRDSMGSPSVPGDRVMMLPTGRPPGSSDKPLAAVRPFQNAVPVVASSGDAQRRSDASPLDSSKNFPQLGHASLPAPSMADDPHLYRLGERLSKYHLDHRAISLQPRGLTNRGNWCYINSTLQALLACPPFYNLMKAQALPPRRSGKSSTPIMDSMVQFVNEFSPLSPASRVNRKEKAQRKDENIEVAAGSAFEPYYIYKMLSNIQSDTFKVEGRQEDAEEFFSCLLNALNDEMLEVIKLVKDTSTEGNLSNGDITNGDAVSQSYEDDDSEWKVIGKRNKGSVTRRAEFESTPVSDIFRGQLRSRVQRAGDHSDNVQPFFTLQLDIEKAQSVREALELLVGRDQLEGVTCSRTNQEVEAWQQVTLEELPLVLVLHLKWFNYKLDGCSKIVKVVEFPIDLKVDGKLMSSTSKYSIKQKQYKLFAVVYHDGKEATKGHYITDAYHVGYGGWVRYDDSTVRAIQEAQMLHPRGSRVPYLLYYRRCDTIGGSSSSVAVAAATVTPDKGR